jgi:hypothetical protein
LLSNLSPPHPPPHPTRCHLRRHQPPPPFCCCCHAASFPVHCRRNCHNRRCLEICSAAAVAASRTTAASLAVHRHRNYHSPPRIGTCPQCRQKFCNSWRLKREVPPPRAGLCTNWVVGSFEFGIYKDIRISREVRPGFAEDSTCPCAFIYDTTPLEELFASWRPPDGRKTRCIQFLAHFAWVDSKNNTVKPGQHPGCLRAHQLVNVRRYAKPQLWGTHAGQSSCPLRRGAQRCDVIAKTRGEMSNDE